ncbi:MAG: TonB dependent receptor [Bacteroidetes bacterium]|nr:TonB dependent receptor [Bacteroidota bacterium]
MRKFMAILTIFFTTLSFVSQAQIKNGKISGTVIDGNTKTIESATITLIRAKDSSVAKMSVADKTGRYQFEGVAEGDYFVTITAVGHQPGVSQRFSISAANALVELKTIELVPAAKTVQGVTVTARKPLVEQKLDRMVVNVEAAATNVGATAMEVLEKSPGITVDKDGNISLKGKQGVQIYIDGRPSYLSGNDLANYLRSLNAGQLEQIEIMTNPPAKYDAAGNSGIINIKTKKTKQFGYNGSINTTWSQGRYAKFNESANFNYRKNKVNLFANLGYNYRKNFQDLDIQRKFIDANTKEVRSHFDQDGHIKDDGESYNGKIGLDYYATKKTTFGVVLNGFYNPGSFSNTSNVFISDPSRVLLSKTISTTGNDRKWKHHSGNLNFRHIFDSTGTELTFDADYLNYNSTNAQRLYNNYFNPDGSVLSRPDTLMGNLPQTINIYTAKSDFSKQLKGNLKFEAGVKTSFVKTDNNAIYDNIWNGKSILDSGRSNHFIYDENVNAAYVNFSKPLSKKLSAQLGLRVENTNAKGNSTGYVWNNSLNKFVPFQSSFKRNYTQLFPTMYLQYEANEKNSFVLNYGRRIERPDYESLNPFIEFLDKYTFEQGNPNLSPQFAHNVELSHTYKGFLTTTLNYNRTTDIIEDVLEQRADVNETFVKKSNIASRDQFGISVNAGGQIKKWWMANLWTNLYNNRYKGIVNGDPISIGATTVQVNLTNQFKFEKGWSAELSGFYTSPLAEGVFQIRAFGQVGVGITKQVFKGKGTFRLSGRDIFLTQKINGTSRFSTIDAAFQQRRDSRQVALGFTYRFSKGKMGNNQKRKIGGADDEKNRVKTGDN